MQSEIVIPNLVGLHRFTAYEGDIERDAEGAILNPVVFESPVYKNLVVDTGKALILDRLFGLGAPPGPVNSVGVGTEAIASVVGQTRLNPSTGGTVLIKAADTGTSRSVLAVSIAATFGTGEANFTWNEGGLFNGTVNGTSLMFNRVIIGPFTKTASYAIVYQAQIVQT